MRKALKRKIGIAKQAKNRADAIATGLRAQEVDRNHREEMERQALLKRDSKKNKRPENEGQSKTALEKKARVAKRMKGLEELNAVQDELNGNLHEADLGLDLGGSGFFQKADV